MKLSDRIQKLVEDVVAMADNYPIPVVGTTMVKPKKNKKDEEEKDTDK